MKKPPNQIGGAKVILYSQIDRRHKFTGDCKQIVAGELMRAMSGLAICQYDGEENFYLFGCDVEWNEITDTWHQTLEDAKHQGEFEYKGVFKTWTKPEEIFDVVNDRDEVIGKKLRREVHRDGDKHRAVHVLVFNSRGEVFLQKRSMSKDTFPCAWDSSASGHLDCGEDYDACAIRELREEIGLSVEKCPKRLFKIAACLETGQEFVWVYRCENEGPFTLHPEEIERGEWFAPEFVMKWIAEKPGDFAIAFVLIWKKLNTEI